MFCKKCGAQLPDDCAFCPQCGEPTEQPKAEANKQFCSHCGMPVEPGQTVCPHCGQALFQNFTAQTAPMAAASSKSKMAAGLLGIFLGSLGIHNFYLGYTGRAVAQLLITVLTCGIGSIASGIWGLIEGIFYLTGHQGYTTDGKGIPLTD